MCTDSAGLVSLLLLRDRQQQCGSLTEKRAETADGANAARDARLGLLSATADLSSTHPIDQQVCDVYLRLASFVIQ